jgi:hypothetical protein
MRGSRFWARILILSDIMAGRSNSWIETHRSHERALVRSIRQQLSSDLLEDWPAGSLDLSPIENLWAIGKRRVGELGPQQKEELIEVVITA